VDKGKATILGAVIGLVIVFSSYLIIQFSLDALGYTKGGSGAWSKVQTK